MWQIFVIPVGVRRGRAKFCKNQHFAAWPGIQYMSAKWGNYVNELMSEILARNGRKKQNSK